MEIITEHWLSFTAGGFLLAMILYGHYRGFLRIAITLISLVLSIVIVRVATPYVTTYIRENTGLRHTIEKTLIETMGITDDAGDIQLPAQQRMLIENMELPRQMKEALLENNNSEIYHLLGVDTFLGYVGNYLTSMILNIIGSVVLFVAINILMQLAIRWLNLIAKLPIVSGINQIAGALLGGLQGLLFLWAGCVLVDLFSQTPWALKILEQIHASVWLTFLYQNNMINWIFVNILRSLI